MLIHRERDFQFRSHAIHAGNQYGIAQAPKTRPKQSPEPADFAEHLRPVSLPSESRKTALKPIPEINIDARAGVGFSFVCHALGRFTEPPRRFGSIASTFFVISS